MNWGGLAIIVGVAALTLHFTAPPPAPAAPGVLAPDAYTPASPDVLGVGRYPLPTQPSTVTGRTVALQHLLAGQGAPDTSVVDLGGYTYNTLLR